METWYEDFHGDKFRDTETSHKDFHANNTETWKSHLKTFMEIYLEM